MKIFNTIALAVIGTSLAWTGAVTRWLAAKRA